MILVYNPREERDARAADDQQWLWSWYKGQCEQIYNPAPKGDRASCRALFIPTGQSHAGQCATDQFSLYLSSARRSRILGLHGHVFSMSSRVRSQRETHTSNSLASRLCFSSWSARRFSASSLVLWTLPSSGAQELDLEQYLQDVSTLAIVVEDELVVFPQRWSMRHGEQCDTQFGRVLHHTTLDFQGHKRRGFVKDSVLHPKCQ